MPWIFQSQWQYGQDLLKAVGNFGTKPNWYYAWIEQEINKGRWRAWENLRMYQLIMSKLVYCTITHPDLLQDTEYMHAPLGGYFEPKQGIVRYLKGFSKQVSCMAIVVILMFQPGYFGANWVGSLGDRWSISGYSSLTVVLGSDMETKGKQLWKI